jgi:hypothetical protein
MSGRVVEFPFRKEFNLLSQPVRNVEGSSAPNSGVASCHALPLILCNMIVNRDKPSRAILRGRNADLFRHECELIHQLAPIKSDKLYDERLIEVRAWEAPNEARPSIDFFAHNEHARNTLPRPSEHCSKHCRGVLADVFGGAITARSCMRRPCRDVLERAAIAIGSAATLRVGHANSCRPLTRGVRE